MQEYNAFNKYTVGLSSGDLETKLEHARRTAEHWNAAEKVAEFKLQEFMKETTWKRNIDVNEMLKCHLNNQPYIIIAPLYAQSELTQIISMYNFKYLEVKVNLKDGGYEITPQKLDVVERFKKLYPEQQDVYMFEVYKAGDGICLRYQ